MKWQTGLLVAAAWAMGGSDASPGGRTAAAQELAIVASGSIDALPAVKVSAKDWPWWRGPTRDGVAPRQPAPPTEWNAKKNVIWKSAVPGRGHGTPSIWGDRIFVATADEDAKQMSLLAYDRKTGRRLWNTVIHRGGFMRLNRKNSHASGTPACDGQRVYVTFIAGDSLWVTATDLAGKIVWQEPAGPYTSMHGYGSSPCLHESLVIVSGDNTRTSFVAALHRKTGKLVWRTPRDNAQTGSYATPIVATVAGRPQVLHSGGNVISSYDPDTGKLLWSCDGPTDVTANTIAFDKTHVYVSGGYPGKALLCIRADGTGDITKSHVAWRAGQGVTYVPSPLRHGNHLYVVTDKGIATCFAAATGEVAWRGRLDGAFSASPVLAGGHLYVPDEKGTTVVFAATPEKLTIVARNDLGDGGMASPVIVDGRIFLRTGHNLYCIGKTAAADKDAAD